MPRNTSPTPDQAGRWVITKFGGPSALEWQTTDFSREPLPDNMVLVRIITAGIAAPDNVQRMGGYPDPRCANPGFTPGYDLVGEIEALGSIAAAETSGLKEGDLVLSMCILGAHATHAVLPAFDLVRLEPHDDPVKMATLPLNYMTAWGMLKHSGVDLRRGGSILLMPASGGLGTAIAQLVATFDLGLTVIGTCSPHKFEFVRSLGVTPVDRYAGDIAAQVRALTGGGEGVDVAFDSVGSAESLAACHGSTKKDVGEVRVVGFLGGVREDGEGFDSPPSELHRVIGERMQRYPRTSFFSVIAHYRDPKGEVFAEEFRGIVEKVRSGKLDPAISRLLPLRDAVEAHKALVSGKDIRGRMVFVVDEELAAKYGI